MKRAMKPSSCSIHRILWVVSIFGSLLLGAAVAPAAGQSKTWHIGLCHVGLDHEPPSLPTLHQTLNEMGYQDGENLRFDWRNHADQVAAEATAREWVAGGVDLIVAFEDQCVRAARAVTTDIPIVMVHAFDPEAAGYIESLARPGRNITGPVSMLNLIGKRLEFAKEFGFLRVLLLLDPADPFTPRELERARGAAAALGLELAEREITSARDVERVFETLGVDEVDVVLPASPSIFTNFSSLILELTQRAGLPVASHRRGWVEQGALFSYAPDFAAAGPVAARYIDRILKGADPAELPVNELSQIVLIVNIRRAQELGIEIPPSILLRADEVIE
jgi:putative ABC transport system substrate-binding protein